MTGRPSGPRRRYVHPNTLLYRVRRFEQISGRSLASTESLVEIWLALRTTAAVPATGNSLDGSGR
jgi:hypothetical protein